MVINENLVDLSKISTTMVDYDKDTKIAKVVNNYHASRLQFALPEGYNVGDTYTFSCKIDKINGFEGAEIKTYPNSSDVISLNIDGTQQSFTFTVVDGNTHIYLYLKSDTKRKGVYKIYDVKIEKGDRSTPYIPNENTIETAKRQYFIGGGTSKKYIQSDKSPLGKGVVA